MWGGRGREAREPHPRKTEVEIRTLQKGKGDLGEVSIFSSWTRKRREAEGVGSKSEQVGKEKASGLQIIKRETLLAILYYILKGRSKLLPNINV